eukprot:gnl/TRDRNA2_/TRDRNA2_164732_c0_seq1.p1 gnl/TRDRNA2_/TRDRNA2_164732_c0~~gnl/TRDRNA2_/TRDRNA2_164732_c0_seq1.p1  ORF type:complete len:656 (-),score=83.55 gnl/TRDRNA2_/TRDRNA2_164732_c0_seq1:302-2269(-)
MAEFTNILAASDEPKPASSNPGVKWSSSSLEWTKQIRRIISGTGASSSSSSKIAPEPAPEPAPLAVPPSQPAVPPSPFAPKISWRSQMLNFKDTSADISTVINSKQGLQTWLDSSRGVWFVVIVLVLNICVTITLFAHPIGHIGKQKSAKEFLETNYTYAAGMRLSQLLFALCWVLSSCISLAMLVLMACKQNHRIQDALMIYLFCMGAACLATTIVAVSQKDMLTALVALAQVPKCVISLVRLYFKGKFIVYFNRFSAVDLTVMGAISMSFKAYFWGVVFFCMGLFRCSYSLFLAYHEMQSYRKAERLIAADQAKYNEAWQTILQREGAEEALRILEEVARALWHDINPDDSHPAWGRQLSVDSLNRVTSTGSFVSWMSKPHPLNSRTKESLPSLASWARSESPEWIPAVPARLKEQSSRVTDLLQNERTQSHIRQLKSAKENATTIGHCSIAVAADIRREMAEDAQGVAQTLKIVGAKQVLQQVDADGTPVEDAYVLYAQARALHGPLHRRLQDWASASNGVSVSPPLKKEQRVAQKVMRSYGGHVSRVVDIVRASIIYEDLQDLIVGLRTIIADDNAIIRAVKNRFDSTYDASTTAGYRDVCLILRLDSNETRAAGCNLHMCEVQLHIQSFFSVKTDEGHARYIEWRNLRCA